MVPRNVLITGGAGFIGSHLSEALLEKGCGITVIDDLSTGKWSNVDHLEQDPNFRIIITSAADSDLLEQEVPQLDFVYHLASAVGVKLIIEEPVKTIETIFHSTDLVLKACSKYRRAMLITSTSEVYGRSEALPFREGQDIVMGPTEKRRWAYACAKALDEFLALAHFYQSLLPVYVVRLFNTVGPRQTGQYGMVLPSFVRQALAEEPITVFGDGTQSRSFTYVGDVVDALLKLAAEPRAIGEVFNIGNTGEVTITELAEKVKAMTGSRSA